MKFFGWAMRRSDKLLMYMLDSDLLRGRWTLVQDAPETVDWTAGGRWKPEAVDLAPTPFQQDACSAPCGTHSGDKWITPQGQIVTIDRYEARSNALFFKELPGGMFSSEDLTSWARPGDGSCLAARAMLPKSERFAQSRLEHIGMDGELAVAAACAADLRRKVSSLRSWPVCPVSKQAYNIRAEGLSDSRNSETLRTWIAQFCCETCK